MHVYVCIRVCACVYVYTCVYVSNLALLSSAVCDAVIPWPPYIHSNRNSNSNIYLYSAPYTTTRIVQRRCTRNVQDDKNKLLILAIVDGLVKMSLEVPLKTCNVVDCSQSYWKFIPSNRVSDGKCSFAESCPYRWCLKSTRHKRTRHERSQSVVKSVGAFQSCRLDSDHKQPRAS